MLTEMTHMANRNENGETTWRKMIFSYKLNIYLSFDSAIPILDIFSREIKTYVWKKKNLYFTAALVITIKNWENPRCRKTGQQIVSCLQNGIVPSQKGEEEEYYWCTHKDESQHLMLNAKSKTQKSPDSMLCLHNTPQELTPACNNGYQPGGFIVRGEG